MCKLRRDASSTRKKRRIKWNSTANCFGADACDMSQTIAAITIPCLQCPEEFEEKGVVREPSSWGSAGTRQCVTFGWYGCLSNEDMCHHILLLLVHEVLRVPDRGAWFATLGMPENANAFPAPRSSRAFGKRRVGPVLGIVCGGWSRGGEAGHVEHHRLEQLYRIIRPPSVANIPNWLGTFERVCRAWKRRSRRVSFICRGTGPGCWDSVSALWKQREVGKRRLLIWIGHRSS